MQLSFMQLITLAASTVGLLSHGAQLWRSVRSGSVSGLSLPSFTLLTATFTLSLLLGIQYEIGPALILAFISTALTVGVLALLSRTVTFVYMVLVAGVAVAVIYGPPAIGEAVLTQRYSELVAFAWGLLFAIAFVPQVLKARRLRDTRDLSRLSLLMSGCSVGLWLTFSVLVRNYSMLFWLSVVSISLLELIRLKVTEPRVALPEAAATDPEVVAEVVGRSIV